ncbi:DUF6316 family protein [Agaribacterium haliotis]|uniref:DUF6316 family protein n=1 Tax=Agaribacterium haliotis TaxID=2013869 RepID=UPI001177752E|nr:DUF6316 family protein [Agaribacterium haliotis]
MLVLRKDDAEERTYFRADRIFSVGREYFFNTREGDTVGPYPSSQAAQRGVDLYIRCLNKDGESDIYAQKVAMQGLWASSNFR